MMTPQEIYNTVRGHLLTQNAKSQDPEKAVQSDDGVFCVYRAPNGMKCAAGVLIKDEFYCQNMEGKRVVHSMVKEGLVKSGVPDDYRVFQPISRLQSVHDNVGVSRWGEALRHVADDFGLQP
jgi:hypothetical protein